VSLAGARCACGHDLIAAAGGALANADLTRVNLAAVVTDGESVYVPPYGEVVPSERGGKIDLNAATAEQLHQALEITRTTARKIVAYRTAHGDFTAVSQLLLVPISRSSYDHIKDRVTV
jgi:competence protein ComEA